MKGYSKMNLARFSVNRPVTAGIISIALLVLGLFYVSRMPVSLYPEVNFPFVAVTLTYPGASPEQIEAKIIKPLEAELSGIKKMTRVIAIVRPGFAQLILGFKMSADESDSIDAVREKVSIVRGSFPQGVKEPIVRRIDLGSTPILIYGVESNASPAQSKKDLDVALIRNLQRTEGINEARIIGIGEERLEYSLDADKLSALRVAPVDIFDGLNSKMAVIPWGDVEKNGVHTAVARKVLSADPKYWLDQVISLRDGRGLRLAEVGNIERTQNPDVPIVLINGKRGLGLVVTKRGDANTVDTVHRAEKIVSEARLPEGTKLFPIINQASFIEENAHEVWIALFVGGAFAILIILLFLTDIKSALISATALPVSIAGSFMFMSWLGFSLNTMSLLALALAIGLLIDDAVVVREAIYAEMEKGLQGAEAAIKGTDKVASAVLATTLAVVAVFLPVGLMQGMVGQFFKQFGLTICISVTISLWVAFTLDPMLSAKFAGKPKPLKGFFWDNWRTFLSRTEVKISRWAHFSFRHPLFIICMALVSLVGASVLVLSRGADFLAFEDRGQFIVNIRAPLGSTRAHSEIIAQDAIARLQDLEGLKDIYASVGEERDETLSLIRFVFTPKTERKLGLLALQSQARDRLKGLAGEWLVLDPPPIEGVGGEAPLSVYVYGDDLKALRPIAEDIRKQMKEIPGVASARMETSAYGPSVDIDFKPQDIGFAGTQMQAIEISGRLALTGLEAGSVGDDNLPFFIRFKKEDRSLEKVWDNLMVPTQRGAMYVRQFSEMSKNQRATSIDREKRTRKMVIWGALDRTRTYGAVLSDVEKLVDKIPKPNFGEVGGDKEVFEEMVESFTIAIVGSLFFIFIILAAQFENLWRPFVILLSLPLAIIGGFVALYLAGQQLAMGALIGMILLIGLAAKNGILLVDAIGTKEKEESLEFAVVESVKERSRPILMTSIAMIFGMIPTAVMRGGGSEFRSPMAITIIGGVISSTFLSFLVVPAIFGALNSFKNWRKSDPKKTALTMLILICAFQFQNDIAAESAKSVESAKIHVLKMAATEIEKTGLLRFDFEHADMKKVVALIKDMPDNSAEKISIESAHTGSDGATQAARLAFLGGAKVEFGREWYSPGITNSFNIPFFNPLNQSLNTIHSSTIIVPKSANFVSLGWQLPLINIQAFEGLKMASTLHKQVPLVEEMKYENATLNQAQILLQTEMALQSARVNERYLNIAQSRLKTVKERKSAGLATKLDETQSIALVQGAIAQWEQANTEALRLLKTFEMQIGKSYPAEGLGVPSFPFVTGKPFQSNAILALEGLVNIQSQTKELTDASFYPSLNFELGYQGKFYDGRANDPQKYMALKAQWMILDGGARVRQVAQGQQSVLEALAQKKQIEIQLQSQFATLQVRQNGLIKAQSAARIAQQAALTAQEQSLDALRAGLAKINDIRSADEAKLSADFALLQLEFALQGLALESMALTAEWNHFLRSR